MRTIANEGRSYAKSGSIIITANECYISSILISKIARSNFSSKFLASYFSATFSPCRKTFGNISIPDALNQLLERIIIILATCVSRKEKIFESADGIARNKRGEDNEQTAPSEISRSASFSLIVSLCVPTICAHVRLPDTGHRHQRFSADRQKREGRKTRTRKRRKGEKRWLFARENKTNECFYR